MQAGSQAISKTLLTGGAMSASDLNILILILQRKFTYIERFYA